MVETVLSTGDVERIVLDVCLKSVTAPACQELTYPDLDFKLVVEPPLASATITDLCNEPLFYSGYISSEEDTSSSDDMSLSSYRSANEESYEAFEDLDTNFPELLAEDCTFVEQQCNQAEAITFVSPGKAKVVRVSKIDTTSSHTTKRPLMSYKHVSSPSRLTIVTSRTHGRDGSTGFGSPRLPPTPELETGYHTPTSSYGPTTPGTLSSSSSMSSTSSSSSFSSINDTTPTSKPRVRNPYRLRLPSMIKRAASSQSLELPLSASTIASNKMVARDARERYSVLDLPPFPRDQLSQTPRSSRPWLLRKESFGPLSSKNRLGRAESGALPTWTDQC